MLNLFDWVRVVCKAMAIHAYIALHICYSCGISKLSSKTGCQYSIKRDQYDISWRNFRMTKFIDKPSRGSECSGLKQWLFVAGK